MKSVICIMVVLISMLTAAFMPAHRKAPETVIHFNNLVGNRPLVLFDETYVNAFGEPFVVSKFRYYISHLSFTTGNKETSLPDSYYLVREEDSLSKNIKLPVTGIQTISFLIGVDSARNVSGVQSGSLDPMNGMFWTWNSGYVFARLEGQSDSSHAPVHSLSWDAGGFRQQENALRQVTLSIAHKNNTYESDTININADILKWFNAVHQLRIATTPVCHQPGKLAMELADNYSTMFSIVP